MALDICGGDGVYLPENNCNDCEQFAERLAYVEDKLDELEPRIAELEASVTDLAERMDRIEPLLENMRVIDYTQENKDGSSTTAHLLGWVENTPASELLLRVQDVELANDCTQETYQTSPAVLKEENEIELRMTNAMYNRTSLGNPRYQLVPKRKDGGSMVFVASERTYTPETEYAYTPSACESENYISVGEKIRVTLYTNVIGEERVLIDEAEHVIDSTNATVTIPLIVNGETLASTFVLENGGITTTVVWHGQDTLTDVRYDAYKVSFIAEEVYEYSTPIQDSTLNIELCDGTAKIGLCGETPATLTTDELAIDVIDEGHNISVPYTLCTFDAFSGDNFSQSEINVETVQLSTTQSITSCTQLRLTFNDLYVYHVELQEILQNGTLLKEGFNNDSTLYFDISNSGTVFASLRFTLNNNVPQTATLGLMFENTNLEISWSSVKLEVIGGV